MNYEIALAFFDELWQIIASYDYDCWQVTTYYDQLWRGMATMLMNYDELMNAQIMETG